MKQLPSAPDMAAVEDARRQGLESGRAEVLEQARKETEMQVKQHQDKINQLEEKVTQSNEELQKKKKEQEAGAEREEKMKNMVKNFRQRFGQMQAERDEMKNKLEQLENSSDSSRSEVNMRFSALKSQFEGIQKENEALKHQLQNKEKELETQRQLARSQQVRKSVVKSTPTTAVSEKSGEAPPTANIKPMAGSSSQAKLSQQSTQAASVAPSRSTPTASIRPMAMLQQRTATVMPTSLATSTVAPSTSQVQAQVTPTPQISWSETTATTSTTSSSVVYAAVPPTPAGLPPGITISAVNPEEHVTEETNVPTFSIIPLSQSQSHEETPETSTTPSIAVVTPSQPQTSTSMSGESSCAKVSPATIMKRPRETEEEHSNENEEPPVMKRTKTRTTSGTFQVTLSSGDESTPVGAAHPVPQTTQSTKVDDIIVLDSDEEEQEESNSEEYDEEFGENDGEEEEYIEEDDDIEDEDIEDNDTDGGDVKVLAASENSEGSQSEMIPTVIVDAPTDAQPAEPHPPLLQRVQPRPERATTHGRQQLAPVANLAQFEEGGDDGIVPSTPTLSVPQRADGFAEAVSSPMAPQQRFVFSTAPDLVVPTSTQQSGLSHDSMMDNTQVDLMQMEESGRSVPTTPIHRSPPGPADGDGQLGIVISNVRGEVSSESNMEHTDDVSQESFGDEMAQEESMPTSTEMSTIPVQTSHQTSPRNRGRTQMRNVGAANRPIPIVWSEPSQGQPGFNFTRTSAPGHPPMRGQVSRRSFRPQTARRGRRPFQR